jgi:hypothetical protein
MSQSDFRTTPSDAYQLTIFGGSASPILGPDPEGLWPSGQPASLPDEAWDVFRLDQDESSDEPEPGDFWIEPDAPDDE